MEKKDNNSRGDLLNDLLENENLTYNLPSAATVVVEKNQKIFFCDKTEYKSGDDRIVITLNSGSDFIDGMNSYLSFNLKVTGATTSVGFGDGSAANIFREILIVSRDGAEIERVRDLNSLVATRCRWTKAKGYLDSTGTASGYNSNSTATTNALKGDGEDYTIPMRELSALFDTDKLLPSFLMAGCRIELALEKPEKAFFVTGNPVTDYTVKRPIMRLETLKLSDSVFNQLTQNAANGGLVIPINTWDLTPATTPDGTVNVEVRRNVSQVLGVLVKTRIPGVDATAESKQDSMQSEATHDVEYYRFRLGSQFIPNTNVVSKVEHFTLANIAFNKFKRTDAENSVSLTDFRTAGRGIIASDLERSAIDLSGVSISNSKVLAYEAKYGTAAPSRTVNVWIQFTRALTVYLTNTLVED